jgi:enamine deaminase RidA (YjgF/YER057c/UK114 family)
MIFPIDARGKVVAPENADQQVSTTLENLKAALRETGAGLDDIVKLNVYLPTNAVFPQVQVPLKNQLRKASKLSFSYVSGELTVPNAQLAMDAVAVCPLPANVVVRIPGKSGDGISSVAVLPAGPKLYVSGMADTNSLVPATQKTLEKLIAAIGQLGSKPEDVVQLKVFLQPVTEAAKVREVIAKFFNGEAPPTILVEWISSNPMVEIELIARADEKFSQRKEPVEFLTPPGTTSTKVYSRVARVNHGNVIYFPGFYGMKANDGAGQVQEIFTDLGAIAKDAGTDFEHLVKATYYVTDNDASNNLNDLRPKYYNPERPPAASKAKVKGTGLSGRTITMDMIAVTK